MSGITELDTVQCSVVFSQWKVYARAAKQLNTLTHTKPEAIEGMSVDAIQLANQSDGKLHHDPYLGMLPFFVLKEHKAELHGCFTGQKVFWWLAKKKNKKKQADLTQDSAVATPPDCSLDQASH